MGGAARVATGCQGGEATQCCVGLCSLGKGEPPELPQWVRGGKTSSAVWGDALEGKGGEGDDGRVCGVAGRVVDGEAREFLRDSARAGVSHVELMPLKSLNIRKQKQNKPKKGTASAVYSAWTECPNVSPCTLSSEILGSCHGCRLWRTSLIPRRGVQRSPARH